MSKKFSKAILALCIAVTNCLAGVQIAKAATLDVIRASDVVGIDCFDYSAENPIENPCIGYSVNVEESDGTIWVEVEAEKLTKHENLDNEKGFWIQFGVALPEGIEVDGCKYAQYRGTEEIPELEYTTWSEAILGKMFQIDVGKIRANNYVVLQWTNGGVPVSELQKFYISLGDTLPFISDITLDLPYVPEIIKADLGTPGPYMIYDVTSTYNQDSLRGTVKITTAGVQYHENSNGESGCWTGFAVKAPTGATQYRSIEYSYALNESALARLHSVKEIADGVMGAVFYTDLARSANNNIYLQWFDAEGNALSNKINLKLDLTDAQIRRPELYDIKPSEVTAEMSFDYSLENPIENPCIGYSMNVEEIDDEIWVDLGAVKLKKHENPGNEKGFWIWFGVKVPESVTIDGCNYAKYRETDGMPVLENDTWSDQPVEQIAFSIDAGKLNPVDTVALQWTCGGVPVSEVQKFRIDVTDVVLDLPYTPEIVKADIGAPGTQPENEPYTTYNVTSTYMGEHLEGTVTVTATGLKEHFNAKGKKGYWTGFAIKAPEGATQFNYVFLGSDPDTATYGTLPVEQIADGVKGAAFYTDVTDVYRKEMVVVQWFDENGNALSNGIYLTTNYSGVDLNWIPENMVKPLDLVDSTGAVTDIATSNTVETTQNKDLINVNVKTTDLKMYTRGDGSLGYWTGFKVMKPEGAVYVEYAMGDSLGNLSDVGSFATEDDTCVYFTRDARYTDKYYSRVDWKDINGLSIYAPTYFEISIEGTTLAKLPDISENEVVCANIVNKADGSKPYASYSITKSKQTDGKIKVFVYTTNLISHSNGKDTKMWAGFAVKAPQDAAYAKYAVSKSATDLTTLSEIPVEVINDNGDKGISICVDASDKETRYISLQWFYANGAPLTNKAIFEMDLTNVNPVVSSGGGGGGGGAPSKPTIKFETNGGSKIENVKLEKNEQLQKPEDPKKEGFAFDGWYTDKKCTKAYDFDKKVTSGFTLYAKWTEAKEPPAPEHTIKLTIGQAKADVNGEAVENDAAPMIVNERTMLPIRFIAEALGAKVDWDDKTKTATITFEEVAISISIGKNLAKVNEKEVELDSPAFISNSRTYLPLRFVMENLGANVDWNGEAKTVTITK